MTAGVRRIILLITVSVTVLFFRLGVKRDCGIAMNSQCALVPLKCSNENDWIVPYFNNELRRINGAAVLDDDESVCCLGQNESLLLDFGRPALGVWEQYCVLIE